MAPSMATTSRLTFLYPHLCASAGRLGEPTARQFQSARRSSAGAARNDRNPRSPRSHKPPPPPPLPPHSAAPSAAPGASSYGTVSTPRRSAIAKRHGTAVEPLPIHNLPKKDPSSSPAPAPATAPATASTKTQPRRNGQTNDPEIPALQNKKDRTSAKTEPGRTAIDSVQRGGEATGAEAREGGDGSGSLASDHAGVQSKSKEASPEAPQETPPEAPLEAPTLDLDSNSPALDPNGPLGFFLDTGISSSSASSEPQPSEEGPDEDKSSTAATASPTSSAATAPNPPYRTTSVAIVSTPNSTPRTHSVLTDRPPHLAPPPYVHHFDTYTFVKQLTAAGWTMGQAIVAMKAIRTCLARNIAVAQSGLVSKSDVENETYLFRAACSELGAEMHNNRRVGDEQLRQQRTHLQHEVDILTQRLNQELQTLNDNVRGMFNDRRMAVREEQKAVESAIQQISYKISVMLNSDARYEVEGLRWVLTRRSVLGIIFMAVITLGSLRYASFRSHERQKEELEEKRREADEATARRRREQDTIGKIDIADAPEAAVLLTAT